jgi:hypothetical protein
MATDNAPVNGTITTAPPDVVRRLEFASFNIVRLSGSDFTLGQETEIALTSQDCMLVLFYGENTESLQLATLWSIVAQQTAGPVFAAINLLSERRVAQAFMRLKSNGSHPLHWASMRSFPFILVYRGGWPVAFYNGAREVQAIIDYSLTLACQANYYEPIQRAGSMQADSRVEMGPYNIYSDLPGEAPVVRTGSDQYTAEDPIRGFNATLPLAATGSTQAAQETQAVRQEEERAQAGAGSLTEETEQAPEVASPPATR